MPSFVMRPTNDVKEVRFTQDIFKLDELWLSNKIQQSLRKIDLFLLLDHVDITPGANEEYDE